MSHATTLDEVLTLRSENSAYRARLATAENQITALQDALRPFARAYETMSDDDAAMPGILAMAIERVLYASDQPKMGDLKRARELCQ